MRDSKESKNEERKKALTSPYRSKSGKRGITSTGSKFLFVAWTGCNFDAANDASISLICLSLQKLSMFWCQHALESRSRKFLINLLQTKNYLQKKV